MQQDLPENIRENVPLKDYSTFKIGGPARYFCAVSGEVAARQALDFALERSLKAFVLGRGSNLLISDRGFDGLVIKMENRGVRFGEAGAGETRVQADGGASLAKLVLDASQRGLGGLEWAAGIPATVGGAVSSNAGAHGREMKQAVRRVRALRLAWDATRSRLTGYELAELAGEECGFSYRDSLFKRTKDYVILSAELALRPADQEELRQAIGGHLAARRDKQPLTQPNVGSIFRNPVLDAAGIRLCLEKCPGSGEVLRAGSLPAGWLIEEAGLKGAAAGGARVSDQHANFIVNQGEACAEDVVILISRVKERVRVRFGIQLHEEIEYVGF